MHITFHLLLNKYWCHINKPQRCILFFWGGGGKCLGGICPVGANVGGGQMSGGQMSGGQMSVGKCLGGHMSEGGG